MTVWVAQEFWNSVDEGYQVTATWHQGCLRDNGWSVSLISSKWPPRVEDFEILVTEL